MAELSKTAKASMVKASKKEQAVETTEEAIRQIRMDRAGQLFIVRMDRIDKLMARYDEAVQEIVRLQFETGSLGLKNESLQKELENRIHTELDACERARIAEAKLEEIISGTDTRTDYVS